MEAPRDRLVAVEAAGEEGEGLLLEKVGVGVVEVAAQLRKAAVGG